MLLTKLSNHNKSNLLTKKQKILLIINICKILNHKQISYHVVLINFKKLNHKSLLLLKTIWTIFNKRII